LQTTKSSTPEFREVRHPHPGPSPPRKPRSIPRASLTVPLTDLRSGPRSTPFTTPSLANNPRLARVSSHNPRGSFLEAFTTLWFFDVEVESHSN